MLPSVQRMADALRPQFATVDWFKSLQPKFMSDDLADSIRRMHEQWVRPDLLQQFQDLADSIRRRAEPPNWTGHNIRFRQAIDCVRDHGLPLAWVPPGDIVALVLRATDPDDRLAVLLAHQALLLEDCRTKLNEVLEPALEPAVTATAAAVAALRDDHPMPAQALAATIVDTLVRHVFGVAVGSTTFRKAHRLRENTPIGKIRTALVVTAAEHALTTFDARGDVPASFNRHASAHTVEPDQFTPANALIGVLLATSMTREAQALLDDGILRAA